MADSKKNKICLMCAAAKISLFRQQQNAVALPVRMAGIYLHIPFCKQACYYCDFHFSTSQQLRPAVMEALCLELQLRNRYLANEAIKTIYLGGGTPSLLTKPELEAILKTIQNNFSLLPSVEITLEANPDDLSEEKLALLHHVGINRLSIGIQTFNNDLLRALNRVHDSTTASTSFEAARRAGFTNISLDLMYALPNQTTDVWLADIERAISLQPEHISCYSLTLEPKTVFGKWSAQGKMTAIDDDLSAHYLELLIDKLEAAGYQHYEVSNFCKPGFHSQHNSSYWKGERYLGIGPSAHSYNVTSRQHNIANNAAYVRALHAGELPATVELLTREDRINEYLLTTLRTHWGCDTHFLQTTFGYDLLTSQKKYIDTLLHHGHAQLAGTVLTLTKKGRLLADKITSDLFLSP
jgi:oxygen-independent coproporphyrinogen III oxidase